MKRERRDEHTRDADYHQPPRHLGEHGAEPAQRKADLGEHPEGETHHGEPGPAQEGAETVRRHDRVPRVGADAAVVGLTRPQHDAERTRGEQDHGRRDEVAKREPARGLARSRVDHRTTSNVPCIE
jgi:hypothetical protein